MCDIFAMIQEGASLAEPQSTNLPNGIYENTLRVLQIKELSRCLNDELIIPNFDYTEVKQLLNFVSTY